MTALTSPVHMRTTVLEWKSSILPPVTLWFTTTEGDWCFHQCLELIYTPETLREKGHLTLWKKQEEEEEEEEEKQEYQREEDQEEEEEQKREECHVGKLFEIPNDTGGTYSKITFRLSDLQAIQRHVFAAPVDITYKDKLESEGKDMEKRNSPHSSCYKLGGAVGLVLSWQYRSRLFFVFHTEIEADKWEKALQLVITELKNNNNNNEKISPIMEPLDASLDPPCQGELLMRKPDGKFQRYYVIPSKYMKGSLHECAYVPKQVIYFSRHRRKWVLQVQKSLGIGIPSRIDLQYTTIREEKSDGYIMFLDVEPYIPNWRASCGSSLNMEKKDTLGSDIRSSHAKRYECIVSSVQEKREWQNWFKSHGALVVFASDVSKNISPVVEDDDLIIPPQIKEQTQEKLQEIKSILKKPVSTSAWSILSVLGPKQNTIISNRNNDNYDYILPNDINLCNSSSVRKSSSSETVGMNSSTTIVLPLHGESNMPDSFANLTENDFSETTVMSAKNSKDMADVDLPFPAGSNDDIFTSIKSTAIHFDNDNGNENDNENGIIKEKSFILEDTLNGVNHKIDSIDINSSISSNEFPVVEQKQKNIQMENEILDKGNGYNNNPPSLVISGVDVLQNKKEKVFAFEVSDPNTNYIYSSHAISDEEKRENFLNEILESSNNQNVDNDKHLPLNKRDILFVNGVDERMNKSLGTKFDIDRMLFHASIQSVQSDK